MTPSRYLKWIQHKNKLFAATLARIFLFIHVQGIRLSDEEVRAIRDIVARSSNGEPVLWMEHAERDNVEVFTREVRGPLDGGGRIFILKTIDGVWTLIDDGELRVWVS